MKKNAKPFHALVYVCPHCRKEFKPKVVGLHVRLCPDCERKQKSNGSLMKDAATYVRTDPATRIGLLERVVGS